MFARRKSAKRFSLLLLEDEELYVDDWVAACRWPRGVDGNWSGAERLPGRLRLATKSLFFEPDDTRVPIVRLPFSALTRLEAESSQAVALSTTLVTRMKANCEDAPYLTDKGRASTWVFVLSYARLDEVLPLAHECLAASRLPALERARFLDAAARAREDAARFDSSRLSDFSERLLWEGPAAQLGPLVREPGRLALSDARVYFQPLHNVAGDIPVRSHPLSAVAAVARRRASLRPLGLELFFAAPAPGQAGHGLPAGPYWDGPSAFFACRSESDREAVLKLMGSQPALGAAVSALAGLAPGSPSRPSHEPSTPPTSPPPSHEAAAALLDAGAGGWLRRSTVAWQRGRLSNFDYLMYLNLAAGRSFNDLAQWPVFPWILADYSSSELDLECPSTFRDLSKPMGAQTEARLADFRRRYREMASLPMDIDAGGVGGPPFMYGTHYSTPGYVLYWLVRAAPGHMLRLQAGRFDAPDRLFGGVGESWRSATTSPTDVKELIPEFFMPGGDWLVNRLGLALGVRQDGRPIGDVRLPPWADGPDDFLAKHRAALESPHVSARLHEWIDLVFGFRQTGPAAADADNVFHHLTYEGAVDISKVDNPVELKALETQINEFGQAPRQLFTAPHPPRLVAPPALDPSSAFGPPAPGAAAAAAAPRPRPAGAATDDTGGRALTLSLLRAVLEAAAPEVASEAAAAAAAAAATAPPMQVPLGRLASGPAGSSFNGDGSRLSPVSQEESLSPLAFAHMRRAAAAAAPAAAAPAPLPASPTGTGRGAARPESPRDQGAAGRLGSLRGVVSRIGSGAASASAALMSKVPSDTQLHDAAGRQPTGRRSPGPGSAASGAPPGPAPAPPAAAVRLTLSWVQEQFARGLSMTSSASSGSRGAAAAAASAAVAALSSTDSTAGDAGAAAGLPPARSPSPAPSPQQQQQQSDPWPQGLPERLMLRRSLRLQQEPLAAVALSPWGLGGAGGSGAACCVGHGGLLRVLGTPALGTLRSAKLQEDLLSVCLLPAAATAKQKQQQQQQLSPGSLGSAGNHQHDVIMLAGSSNRTVIAFSPPVGRLLGSWTAHEDAVSCVLQLGVCGALAAAGGGGARLLTASWDCSVKVWDVSEGRQPWDSSVPIASGELRDFESGVWAAAASGSGQVVVTGTEEGTVAAWDLRSGRQAWSTKISDDYVGGLSLLPGGAYVAAVSADGAARLLEWRRGGDVAVTSHCGAPLRCCTCDGRLLIAGGEAGQLHLWDVASMTGQQRALGDSGFSLPGPDGFYPPISCGSHAPVNGVSVSLLGGGGGGGASVGAECCVAAAQEDGTLALFMA